ncbi:Probable Xaa-Pro aminopeptidase PEPP; AltName: Full=Aminoacylproline aminopeptidase; AltName: Full=Prolidase [Serendipita indica DSM 11827]|nr:Probable Xaa-Pro aminopeptidase PEPP; AltName: Full=Aminoacylproline aminopeptidase; AltName: Full=Prolidase [Serendipita indica DSM 11827]
MSRYPASKHFEKLYWKLKDLAPHADQNKSHIIVLSGERTGYRNDTDRELIFRQESNFFWLSGCDLPGSHLVLYYDFGRTSGSFKQHLFIPEEDPLEVLWSPAPPNMEEARKMYDVTEISFSKDFQSVLTDVLKNHPQHILHVLPSSSLYPSHPDTVATCLQPSTDQYLLTALHQVRLIKDEYEISLIRKANEISSRAHEVVMRLLGQGVRDLEIRSNGVPNGKKVNRPLMPHEWRIHHEAEAEAVFVASCRREGSIHQAYLPIVAASTRASTLHYCCNDKQFSWGPDIHSDADLEHDHQECLAPQVLLIDAGCEWRNYASDITRVTPVGNGGKFSPEARAIYATVLKMQLACIEAAKPGVHWDHLHLKSHEILVEELIKLGILVGDYKTVLESGVSAAFYPHGLGHSLGMDVHDCPSASKPTENKTIPASSSQNPEFYRYLRLRLPLAENMVVTIEPGCYFSPHQLAPVRNSPYINQQVLSRYEYVGGVRIEDVVLITANGCEVLTPVGKDIEWLEAVASGSI